ncbi:MAG: response regulator [Lachnospiraceae bacterium]|nr:response regulator [Lachnospiraceae bacterium]
MNKHNIVYTNDQCIGCNKCINVCSAIGACISKEEDGRARIEVDGSKCVACGSCIDVCVHGAREFEDDTERFFKDLRNGESISLMLAPAFKANYPEEYESVLGGLKELGVNRIISVSFGADICTWGYINYIKKYDFLGGISQPCPAVVSYIERYLPELLPRLFPVQSPLMCAAIYARKELEITDKLAFISPCIAKKLEIEDPHNIGLVNYNVTFEHLMRYVKDHHIAGPDTHSEIEYGLGSFYPTPGGLAETVRWFLGDQVFIRQIEGERRLYEWLHINKDRIRNRETPFLFIDALNCEKGCICGTAVNPEKSMTDDALYSLLRIREESKKSERGDAWSRDDSPEERLKNYNRQFEHLLLEDYLRGYTDRSAECRYEIPNEEELEKIFLSLNKVTPESRQINCTCCGYESCRQMAFAIYNGFNHKENCIYYEKTMVHELEIEKAIAEEATKAKTAFLANMSHEIRTPINAMLGMNEMILRESRNEDVIGYAETIRRAGNTLLSLVNNILDISRIEDGTARLEPEAISEAAKNNWASEKTAPEKKTPYKERLTAMEATVLTVDDTPMNLMVFKSLLKQTGIKIDTAGSGDEGLLLSSRKKYDMIFMDHMMPGKDGIETLHELRAMQNNPNLSTPIVCLTANAITGSRERYLSEGFAEYLSKPIDFEKLEEVLQRFLPPDKVSMEASDDARGEEGRDDADEELPALLKTLEEENLLDVRAGIKNSGSPGEYIPLLKIFCNSIDEKIEELRRYFREGDLKNYTIKVHALKSSAKIIGAMELGEEAQSLEDAGKRGDSVFIRGHQGAFMELLKDLKEPLSRIFAEEEESEDSSDKPMEDKALMSEIFEELYKAADAMDCDRIEGVFEKIKNYRFSEENREFFKKLKQAADNLDYDAIKSLLLRKSL